MDETLIPVLIKLRSSSCDEYGMEEPPLELITVGHLREIPTGFLLEYEESLVDEGTGEITMSPVSLTLEPDCVIMNRIGDFGSTLLFKKHCRFEGMYHTPYGEMGLSLYTTCMICKASREKGMAKLEYELSMNGRYVAMQKIYMEYVAQEPEEEDDEEYEDDEEEAE